MIVVAKHTHDLQQYNQSILKVESNWLNPDGIPSIARVRQSEILGKAIARPTPPFCNRWKKNFSNKHCEKCGEVSCNYLSTSQGRQCGLAFQNYSVPMY